MRIATLQFSPRVGEIAANFSRAESLLMRQEREGELQGVELLVLPELAFTGYNHPSLSAIAPYLEPTAAGPSTRWASRTAKRLKCTVAVGYPEEATSEDSGNYNTIYDPTISRQQQYQPQHQESGDEDQATPTTKTIAYNSLVFVDSLGEVVAHHRKAFLYYTDEVWATEGPDGFYKGVLPMGERGSKVKVAAGICMDINPYKFETPWTMYEFGNHCREARVKVVVISMAWLTRLSHEEVYGVKEGDDVRFEPDMDTVGYWIERFRPLLGTNGAEEETVVVFANRAGEDGTAERIGEVRYAGSSCVIGMTKARTEGETNVRIWDVLGRGQDGLLIVDTNKSPLYAVQKSVPELPLSNLDETKAEAIQTLNAEIIL